jgi:glycosyltransferase involved in cell wall biosynthesis
MPTISAVVHTLNEERNLPFALRSVRPWVDEIVVVDMASDDGTVAVARAFGAHVVAHERVGFVEPAREAGCSHARGDFVLMLDADEIVLEPLSRRPRSLADGDEADLVRVPRVNYLLGGPLAHTGWNCDRDMQTRFFRRGMLRPSPWLHGQPAGTPEARWMNLAPDPGVALVHFNYLDTTHFLHKLDVYAGLDAVQAQARGERPSAPVTVARMAREWLTRYVRHAGFRDGWRGFSLSALMVAYHVAVYAKQCELGDVGSREEAARRYRHEAERLLAAYGAAGRGPDGR